MVKQHYSVLFTILGFLHLSYGCSIEGIIWLVPETQQVVDTFRGILFSGATENIQGINNVQQREGLNQGPYINVSLDDSVLNIFTNAAFENYEDIETQTSLGYSITLRCTDSTTRTLVFIINLTDTNNNDPVFLPTNNYEFTIAPPVPPGFLVTTCLNDILVRDIDLTTYRIDFEIEGSDLFEISFDPSSEVTKEFKATLKTTDLIRSIAEPIILTVTATDVDLTEGPPRTANATVVITADSQFQFPDEPIFSQSFYLANYNGNNEVILQDSIFLRQGYDDDVKFSFQSDQSEYFDLDIDENNLSFNIKSPIPVGLYGRQIYLVVEATRQHTSGATATVILKLPEDTRLEFENAIYEGTITDNVLELPDLKLKQGYEGFNITVDIESEYTFRAIIESNVIKISMDPLPTDVIQNNNLINLQITASNNHTSAVTVVILEIIKDDNTTPVFENNFYSGSYSTEIGLTLEPIILTQGFDETVKITLEGEHFEFFKINQDGPRITLTSSTIPSDIFEERNIVIIVLASKPRTVGAHAAVNVALPEPPEIDDVSFDRNLYNGKLHDGVLSHDKITLSGFNGTNIQITGEHSSSFRSEITNGVVNIETTVAEFPKHLTYIALELQADSANAVLLIDVSYSENPELPKVSFKSQSYLLWADVQQTGVVGAVEATADNGEAIVYSLSAMNEHIQSRININSDGEILLTTPFDKGVYTFNAVATSVTSQVQATVPVLLRVDTLPECSNEPGLSPLIILERLEEEPHRNLVVLDKNEHRDCQYRLSNVFPKNQSWLYVDNDGLHAKAIDREDRSIAFMTLSQIQVELTLECDSDELPAFSKRSLGTENKSDLYSYDDGLNKWVLTDTILFNARRSFVNLIVKDINDHSPIFLEKGNEPIYVGYPVSEIEGTVLPRFLAELKATDADIGENAAVIYWSGEDNLAVSPNTGLVHVRNNAKLDNNSRLTIYAIDQNGKGRNGTIDIVVKLLDKNQIVVITVRDAFLEDEVDMINKLSIAVGYEVKVLKAVVIPNNNEELPRRKRDVASNSRASLQLYVYGLLESEPVDINQLTRDINNINITTVNIARIVTLEDHLEIRTARGLLASTITLAILLFIVVVAIAVMFFLKRKTSKNYKQFSNRSSSVSQSSTPNLPKIEVVTKTRPNIDEIKRTERRLQEMLDKPIENTFVLQGNDEVKPPVKPLGDAIVNISSPDSQLPIVIQSIDKLKDKTDESDDNDEFGETKKPRKSVVTFNENVEKIIHIENVPDDENSDNNQQIYKL